MPRSILIIEDDRVLNKLLASQLDEMGYGVVSQFTWHDAQVWLKDHDPDLILLDRRLPDASGDELIPALALYTPVVMLTAHGGVRQAVDAIHAGAADYLSKPVDSEELALVIERVLKAEALRDSFEHYRAQTRGRDKKLLVGHSAGLAEVERMIEAVAPSDMTVLIQGESGVGKELVAQELHERSPRAPANFVAIDCCTLQETLFETELFGHERGAFTSADQRKKGMIEVAEGGTLFLDEIGEIGAAIQAKLLRVLETGKFRRVGGTQDLTADVRVVAATNRDLEKMVEDNEFRGDLFYRLSAFAITMPPLRERREDIPDLAQHFVHNHNFSRRIHKRFTQTATRQLVAYDWPGNVRELKNVVERAIILSAESADIRPQDLSFSVGGQAKGDTGVSLDFDKEPSLQEIEKDYLELLLKKYSGHRQQIAEIMGVSERNIYRMIERHSLKE